MQDLPTFTVKFSFKGKSITVSDSITQQTTSAELLEIARKEFQVPDDMLLKLLHKGKIVGQDYLEDANDVTDTVNDQPAFPASFPLPKNNGAVKIVVMGTETQGVRKLNSGRSDPLMRGFDDERSPNHNKNAKVLSSYWGPHHSNQHPEYKFCRFQECTDASFGTRPGASTPHAFEARHLLERLATDPGIVAILKSRELIVGTLGEMDPIDDRLMQKKQQEGGCLLGYNTNHGMRIDVKLRTDDLSSFRPYEELAATLVHELSHNWVGEHNILFWTNYGQMRVEYLWKHACLILGGEFVNGKRTATLAGVVDMIVPKGQVGGTSSKEQMMDFICQSVFKELEREMAQHFIPVQMVAQAIADFSKELLSETSADMVGKNMSGGQRLGSGVADEGRAEPLLSARERALAAAEKRAKESKKSRDE